MQPLIAFLESVGPILVATRHADLRDRWMIKFVLQRDRRFVSKLLRSNGPVFIVSEQAMRLARTAAGLLQLPIAQQSALALSFKWNVWQFLISDGLFTEYFSEGLIRPHGRFYSMLHVTPDTSALSDETIIVGSNWVEFGCMRFASYRAHLRFLRARYPDAIYYCHPKELSRGPEDIFGADRVRRPNEPIEMALRHSGLPRRIVGVCSSSLLSISSAQPDHVVVDLVELAEAHLDGPAGSILHRRPRELSIAGLQNYLADALAQAGVRVERVKQP